MRVRKSTQVALGGLSASLCLVFMMLTAMIPFATFALPALAGMVLISVVVELGYSSAILVYVATSLLSLIIVPDKEAAIMFVAFFGYYPILKGKLDGIRSKILALISKLAVFNCSVVAAYWLLIHLFGIDDVLEEVGPFGRYSVLVLLLLGNVVFLVYDFATTQIAQAYLHVFRPRFLRKFR